MLRSATDLQWPFIWSNSREREKGAMCFQMEKHKCDCVTERKLNRLPLGQTREKDIALSEYNKTQVPELMTTVMSRYHDRPYNVNEL